MHCAYALCELAAKLKPEKVNTLSQAVAAAVAVAAAAAVGCGCQIAYFLNKY